MKTISIFTDKDWYLKQTLTAEQLEYYITETVQRERVEMRLDRMDSLGVRRPYKVPYTEDITRKVNKKTYEGTPTHNRKEIKTVQEATYPIQEAHKAIAIILSLSEGDTLKNIETRLKALETLIQARQALFEAVDEQESQMLASKEAYTFLNDDYETYIMKEAIQAYEDLENKLETLNIKPYDQLKELNQLKKDIQREQQREKLKQQLEALDN